MIASDAITSDKIVSSAVTADKIAANAVTANKILAGAITTTHLDSAEIFANEANVGVLVATDIFANAISTHSLVVSASTNATNALSKANTAISDSAEALETANSASEDASEAVTTANAANTTASTANTNASNALTKANTAITDSATAKTNASTALTTANTAKSTADSVNSVIASWCYNNDTTYIDGGNIYTGTITTAKIAAGAVTAEKILAGTITADRIDIDDLFAQNITATGKITGGWIDGGTVSGSRIYSYNQTDGITKSFELDYSSMTQAKIGDDYNIMNYFQAGFFDINYDSPANEDAKSVHLSYTGIIISRVEDYSTGNYVTQAYIDAYGNAKFAESVTASSFIGNATTATTLAKARTVQVNLESTSTASFDGSANITPGVTGTLAIGNGGTGATTAAGVLTNLGITATAAELNYCDGVTSNIQTQLNSKAASDHTHSYLPLSGGTLTGELLINTGTTQSATKGIKWSAINSKNPYIGYATDQTDGTFVVCSLLGTAYSTGLAIGGGSGNLLYKGSVVLNAANYTSYCAMASHTHSVATTSAAGFMSATDKTKLDATNDGYGTCSTAAATAAKVITISGNSNWTLVAGSKITVLFSYTNTAESPTFNVNGTGAKNVYYTSSQITTSNLSYAGYANRPMNFVYDGTRYRFIGWGYESGNTNTYLRVYRQTSGFDGNYPLLVGRTKATSIGTVGSNSTYSSTYGVFRENDDGDATLTANPADGSITATTFIGALSGNASTATKLATARTIQTNLGSTSIASFNGSANITPGVTGTLAIGNGGTGATTAAGVLTNLGITATATELNYCDGVTSNIQTQLNGKMSASIHCIELNSSGSLANYGGFIDFHFNGSTSDYTSRIIENASGQISINNVTITTGKVVTATTFVGALTGNATSATKATQDGNGKEISRIYGSLVPSGTSIPSGADLNTTDYIKVGNYCCSANATVKTLLNCPLTTYDSDGNGTAGTAFMMQVYAPLSSTFDDETTATYRYRIRKIIKYNSGEEYIQYVYSGSTAGTFTYGSWRKVLHQPVAGTAIGGSTQPVYVYSDGTITACTKYAGGTAVTLNGSSKAGSTASFYAPTSAGTSGYLLKSSGSGAPTWLASVPIANGGTGATTAAAALTNLGAIAKSAVTSIGKTINFTSSTSLTSIGTITIPANCIYFLNVTVYYANSKPTYMRITNTTAGVVLADSAVGTAHATGCCGGHVSVATTLNIYAQYASAASNVAYVYGWYMSVA